MKILLLTAHDVAEYDDLRMFTDMGHDVFSIGAYIDPVNTVSQLRPALPDAPQHPDLVQRCIEQREKHVGDEMRMHFAGQVHHIVDWAKADLHQDIIDWADVIICHHYLESWIIRQWDRLRDKRVIWRTCGQSNALLEEQMLPLHEQGLEIVRYSPREEVAFKRLGTWAGQDALIRFGKYPDDYGPWIGDELVVGNVTQNMAGRGEFCGFYFWQAAVLGLPVKPAGLQSEDLPGGTGDLTYPEMIEYLQHVRAYLYTGTQPASYTLGLIEAMLAGVPVVTHDGSWWWMPDLFESDIVPPVGLAPTPRVATMLLNDLLGDEDFARETGAACRTRAIELFGIEKIKREWASVLDGSYRQFLGHDATATFSFEPKESVSA